MAIIRLRCGCIITKDGRFVLGDECNKSGCKECTLLQNLHPFGMERLD